MLNRLIEHTGAPKIEGNMKRDRTNVRRLRKAGERVIRVWEHELKLGCKGRWIRTLQRLLSDESIPSKEYGDK